MPKPIKPKVPGAARIRPKGSASPKGAAKPVPAYKPPKIPSYTPAQQARRDVMGVVNPVIGQIQADIGRRTRAGQGAIAGYTRQLAGQLAPAAEDLGGIYGQAQQQQAAVDAALTGGLRTQTNTDADALAERLRALGPTANQADVAREGGMGAAGALQGTGSASLSQLIAEGAAAQAYGQKLPGIARLGGLQSGRELQLSAGRELAEQTGDIRARIPEMVMGRMDQFRANQADRAKTQLAQQIAAQEFGLDVSKFQQGAAHDAARLDLDTSKAAVSASQGAQRLALSQAKYAADLGYKNRKLALDAAKTAKRNASKKGISPTSYAKLKQQAAKDAERAYYGLDPVTNRIDYEGGNGVGRTDYQTALTALMKRHSLKLDDAQGILDSLYEPGEDGRPFINFQQRQQLLARGVPAQAVAAAMWDERRAAQLLGGR